jgi:hypothetical protein
MKASTLTSKSNLPLIHSYGLLHLPKMHNGPSPKLKSRLSKSNEREISKIQKFPKPPSNPNPLLASLPIHLLPPNFPVASRIENSGSPFRQKVPSCAQ